MNTTIYVPNGKTNIEIGDGEYRKAVPQNTAQSTGHKDKSVSGKSCHICVRPTQHYIHSTSRYFTEHTGRPRYIYGNKPYVVCVECIDILGKVKEGKPDDYVPTNTDIVEYVIYKKAQLLRGTA